MAVALKGSLTRWLGGRPDDDVLRWLYRGLLVATVAVLVLDYSDIQKAVADRTQNVPGVDEPFVQPSATPLPERRKDDQRRTAPLPPPSAQLRDKMTFDLDSGGRLRATGTIVPGTAARFAEEVGKRGSYVKTVVLQSPGGSVEDAMAMGQLIRDKNFATEVEPNRYCASSCPLIFSGGVERRAGAKAAIGVHQIFSGSAARAADGLSEGMADAQQASARVQKYLRAMGIDLAVWTHAMETPRQELYYFTPKEMLDLKLATKVDGAAPLAARQ